MLDASLDVVRVITVVLALYQVGRLSRVPGVEQLTLLEAISLWQLIVIYLASSALTLVLVRFRAGRA